MLSLRFAMCSIFRSAPIVRNLEARAVSDTEIEASWVIDTSRSGHLQLFQLECADEQGFPTEEKRLFEEESSTLIRNLSPNTTYYCTLTAMVDPAEGQHPDDCTTSVKSKPIRTHLDCRRHSARECGF